MHHFDIREIKKFLGERKKPLLTHVRDLGTLQSYVHVQLYNVHLNMFSLHKNGKFHACRNFKITKRVIGKLL